LAGLNTFKYKLIFTPAIHSFPKALSECLRLRTTMPVVYNYTDAKNLDPATDFFPATGQFRVSLRQHIAPKNACFILFQVVSCTVVK